MSSRLIFILISVAIAWLLALNTGRELAFNLAYLLTGVLLLSYVWARSAVRNVSLRRLTRSRRSQVGQYLEEQFEIINRGRLPKLWLEVEDFSTLLWHDASRVINSLGRGRTYRWQAKTLCTQRGRYRLGPILLHSGDPLGIFAVHQQIPTTSFLVVYPLTLELTSFEPSISDLAGGEARHRRTYQMTTNAAGVRDYAPGDSLNRIHWPTTARARRLMTKEFELDPTADVWLYLDLYRETAVAAPWQPQPPEMGIFAGTTDRRRRVQIELPPSTTEYAVTITASLARYFLMRNRAVGLSSRGRAREFVQTDRGERQLTKLLEALAVVDSVGDLPFAYLITSDGVRLNRNDTILAVTADPNPEWARALQHLQRRGVNSIAVVVDGASFGGALDYGTVLGQLQVAGIPTYLVRRDDPLDQVLAHPMRPDIQRP